MVKSNSRQGKHREFENFGKKHRENTGTIFDRKLKLRKYAQKKLLRDVDGFIFDV